MTWMLTGASGLLGPYLIEAIEPIYNLGTSRIELTDEGQIYNFIDFMQPGVLIHAAAYTDVDGCEEHQTKAEKVNHIATETIAEALPSTAKLVYISTDMVYPDTPGPHPERDVGRPLNAYALTKRLGEVAALKHNNTLVLRTNFFGPSKNNRKSYSDRILADEYEAYYDDVFFSPLHMRTLAELVVECVERNLIGVFNAGSRNGYSKHGFAQRVSGTLKNAAKASLKVPRPHDMRMDVSRLERVLGRSMPSLDSEIWRLKQ